MERFHTDIFDRLASEKQERILKIAINHFAVKGFLNSRIKEIALEAGISYGSMYSYFPTKDDLLRTIIIRNIKFQKKLFSETINDKDDTYTNLEHFFELSLKAAEENPDLVAIWRDIAQSYHTKFLSEIVELETEALSTIRDLIHEGIKEGFLAQDILIEASSYVIDSISSELLSSFVSEQNKEKKKLFFGTKSNALIVKEIMVIVRKMLPRRETNGTNI
ncbi:hypothetical protein MASR2M78_19740 [Treponema sp.]